MVQRPSPSSWPQPTWTEIRSPKVFKPFGASHRSPARLAHPAARNVMVSASASPLSALSRATPTSRTSRTSRAVYVGTRVLESSPCSRRPVRDQASRKWCLFRGGGSGEKSGKKDWAHERSPFSVVVRRVPPLHLLQGSDVSERLTAETGEKQCPEHKMMKGAAPPLLALLCEGGRASADHFTTHDARPENTCPGPLCGRPEN